MLACKYATGRCTYCGEVVCDCPEVKRQAARLAEVNERAQMLTIPELSELLNRTYGEKNRAAGIDKILWHLNEEIGELIQLEQNLARFALTPNEMRTQFALEAADVIAWTIAVANFFRIDLEAAIYARYGTVCWHCRKCPCGCLLNARQRRLPQNWKKKLR
jgi:NTP pyrophosphatase (non-canonical NTP hydrolase)